MFLDGIVNSFATIILIVKRNLMVLKTLTFALVNEKIPILPLKELAWLLSHFINILLLDAFLF